MEPDWPRRTWTLFGIGLAAVFVGLAAGFVTTGLHWVWWVGLVPSGVAMGWAFGRASSLRDAEAPSAEGPV